MTTAARIVVNLCRNLMPNQARQVILEFKGDEKSPGHFVFPDGSAVQFAEWTPWSTVEKNDWRLVEVKSGSRFS